MENSLACKPFRDHADDESDHGCATVEKLHLLELLFMDRAGCLALEPSVVSRSAIHGGVSIETNCNRGLTLKRYLAKAFAKALADVALDTAPGTWGKRFHRIREQCRTRVHKK